MQRRLPPPGLPLLRGNEATDGSVFFPGAVQLWTPTPLQLFQPEGPEPKWQKGGWGGGGEEVGVGVEGRRVRRPTGKKEEAETMARIVLLFVFSVHTLA